MKMLFPLLIVLLFSNMSCTPDKENKSSDKTVVRDVVIEHIYHEEERTPPPPPPPLQQLPRPTTFEEWFYRFSEKEKPAQSFVDYQLGYWELEKEDLFVLNVAPVTVEVINGSPSEEDLARAMRYYPIFRKEYMGLDWQQVLQKMKTQLKEYSGTQRFKKTALANAKAVTMKFDDGEQVRLK